jgi:aryl carrier-like protein
VPALRRALPGAAIWNAYGTTEIPQVASLHRCRDGEEALPSDGTRVYVPIGTGAGARRLVVTRGDEVAAVGELGEICVLDALAPAARDGGALPARVVAGQRLLLTGDRGRVGLDGEVDWCGRIDRQLSIAGHRVEPDQVELRLLEDAELADAVVAPDALDGRATGLVGYVVPGPALASRAPDAVRAHLASLQDRLRASLPPWCVPSALRVVPRIVTDRNGKPDVPATAALAAEPGPAESGPDGIEELVERSVRRLLPAGAALRPETNFFEAGLDSLTLLRLHADLREAGYADLDPTDLFQWPNLRALSAALAARRAPAAGRRPPAESGSAEQLRQRRRALREALFPGRTDKEDLPWSRES